VPVPVGSTMAKPDPDGSNSVQSHTGNSAAGITNGNGTKTGFPSQYPEKNGVMEYRKMAHSPEINSVSGLSMVAVNEQVSAHMASVPPSQNVGNGVRSMDLATLNSKATANSSRSEGNGAKSSITNGGSNPGIMFLY
jgi:hypothetical protein